MNCIDEKQAEGAYSTYNIAYWYKLQLPGKHALRRIDRRIDKLAQVVQACSSGLLSMSSLH
jgi:hypothetical protein